MDYKIKIKNIDDTSEIVRLPSDAQGFVLAQTLENFAQNDCVIIAENDAEMENLTAQIRFFNEEISDKFDILFFPAWDCAPYDQSSPKPAISGTRIKCLYKIINNNSGKKKLIITNLNAVLQKTLSPKSLKNYGLHVTAKSKISIAQICEFLVISGYNRSASANSAGEFAVRGGIVDFVTESHGDLIGYRIDFFGDEVESIKAFDPLTQITQETLRQVEILPASEVILNDKTVANFRQKYRGNFGAALDDQLYSAISEKRSYSGMQHWLPFFYEEELVSFFDYFAAPAIFLNQRILQAVKTKCVTIAEYYQARIDAPKHGTIYNAIAPDLLYLNEEKFLEKINQQKKILLNSFDTSNLNQRIFDLEIKPIPDFALAAKANKQNAFELMKGFLETVR
jgi:transcription-repair coupling factor (superfamily II helicase)